MVRARIRDLPDAGDDVAVVDRVLDPVAVRRLIVGEVELDVDEEALAVAPLLLEHAVIAVQHDPVELDRHVRRPPARPPRRRRAPRRGRDVVGAEERRAAVERRDRRTDRRCSASRRARSRRRARARACSSARARRAPADRSGRSGRARGRARGSGRASCRSRCPGRGRRAPRGIPAATAAASRSSRNDVTSLDDVVVARLGLHRARLSLHVHEADVRARVGDDARELRVAAQRGDVVHERAPSSSARRATSAFDVSIETGGPTQPLQDRHDAASSSARRRRSAPGRVDSPPTSTTAAPSASRRRAARPRPRARGCRRRRRSCRA